MSASLEGFWSSAATDSVDSDTFPGLGAADRVVTVSADGTATGAAYLFQAARLKYGLGDEVGALLPFGLEMSGSNAVGMVRGQVAKARGAVSGTGPLGSVLNLGAPAAGQYAYASLHVFGTPGTSLTAQLQSASDAAMTTPTTRATLGPLSAAGGAWATRVAGPLTGEAYWRLNVSAITGTFIVAGAIAVA